MTISQEAIDPPFPSVWQVMQDAHIRAFHECEVKALGKAIDNEPLARWLLR